MGSKKKAKSVYLSKVRVTPERLRAWQKAYESFKGSSGDADMPFAAWVRLVLDQAAREQTA